MQTFGELMRQRRHQLGKTQEQMARLMDITVRQYCRWENGESKITVYALAVWLELTETDYSAIHHALLWYGRNENKS